MNSLLRLSLGCLFVSFLFSCGEEPLHVKRNYQSLSPDAKYLGECRAKYDDRSQIPMFTQIDKLPYVLITSEFDSNKHLLNKKTVGAGIRHHEFYDENDNLIKSETFKDDQPQHLYDIEYNERGLISKEYEMLILNGNITKYTHNYTYDYGEDSTEYVATVKDKGKAVMKIYQLFKGDTVVKVFEDISHSTPIIKLQEQTIFDGENPIWKNKGNRIFRYTYNESGQCIKEVISSKDAYGNKQNASRTTIYRHGLIASILDEPGDKVKYKLFKLEYDSIQ